jgi:hypothetical protein
MAQFPFETIRFHPTFAYEMIWNLLFAGLIIWLVVKKGDELKTGVIAALCLIVAGVGRTWIELFRPDQPRFFETPISTSMLVSIIFTLLGVFILLVKLGKISVPFMQTGSTDYIRKPIRRPPGSACAGRRNEARTQGGDERKSIASSPLRVIFSSPHRITV